MMHSVRLLHARALAILLIVPFALVAVAPGSATVDGAAPDHRTIVHVLNRLGFGPRPGDVERVRQIGVEAYVDLQLNPERIDDTALEHRLAGSATLGMTSRELAERYFIPAQMERRARQRANAGASPAGGVAPAAPGTVARRQPVSDAMRAERRVLAELSEARLLRAIESERQLQEVLVDFWFNHFNVFAGKGPTRVYLTEYERDAIRPHVLGTFRDLLGAVAKSPAMLVYLDNWMSAAPDVGARPLPRSRIQRPGSPPRGGLLPRGSDIGRRRRPGEVRTLDALSQAQALRRARGLNENYARELMELHTLGVDGGYTQEDVVQVARVFTGWTLSEPRRGGGFRFEPRLHVPGDKKVLGTTIPAGGQDEGEKVLDLLARHPSTARFVATKLARRFVADEPPASVVDRAAATFIRTDGDLRAVVRTIVTSPEFLAPDTRGAKVKTPLEFLASAVRVTGARVADAATLGRSLREMGMPLYFSQPPTGYPDTADAWVNTGALLARMNFALALAANRVPGVSLDWSRLAGERDLESDRARLARAILGDEPSRATNETLARAENVTQLGALALGAPEFQRR